MAEKYEANVKGDIVTKKGTLPSKEKREIAYDFADVSKEDIMKIAVCFLSHRVSAGECGFTMLEGKPTVNVSSHWVNKHSAGRLTAAEKFELIMKQKRAEMIKNLMSTMDNASIDGVLRAANMELLSKNEKSFLDRKRAE